MTRPTTSGFAAIQVVIRDALPGGRHLGRPDTERAIRPTNIAPTVRGQRRERSYTRAAAVIPDGSVWGQALSPWDGGAPRVYRGPTAPANGSVTVVLSLIHISEPTRRTPI